MRLLITLPDDTSSPEQVSSGPSATACQGSEHSRGHNGLRPTRYVSEMR